MSDTPYPRGTPRRPLSFTARLVIISLLVLISTAVGAAVTVESYNEINASHVLLAAAGAIACLAGLIYDSTMYALALEVVIFCGALLSELQTHDEDLPHCLAVAAKSSIPLITVAVLSMLVPSFFSTFALILQQPLIIAPLVCVFPMLSFLVAYVLMIKSGEVTWSITLMAVLVGATYTLLMAWYFNRTHKHMNLLDNREMGIAFCTANAFLISLHQQSTTSSSRSSSTTMPVIMPALVGSLVCTIICIALGATADVWHVVGSGQFWMVSLDGALGMAYFVVPSTILGWRFWSIYGDFTHGLLSGAVPTLELDMPMSPTQLATGTLMLMLGITSTLGVAVTRSLCPFGAHLYGRVYCVGWQSSKKVAVCMDWSEGKALLEEFSRLQASINFVVTRENLRQDAEQLQEATKAGHTLMPYTGERKAHVEYQKLFGLAPAWAHGETYPSDILACNKNDTKIALWSNYYTNTVEMESLFSDIESARGGSIICFENVNNVVEVVEEISSKGYSVAPLSEVTKDFEAMTISAED
mmetsp:Transcript_5945/g.9913  ORF Transcript_5945/g.9913 Transcript_5945/m.9913 type:complete len:528 (-) Transcript_5945:9-1592(-)